MQEKGTWGDKISNKPILSGVLKCPGVRHINAHTCN